MKKELLRDTWPKVRIEKRGDDWYCVIDPRPKMKREFTKLKPGEATKQKAEAIARAQTILADFSADGAAGVAMPLQLRAMAFQGEKLLAPHGKTILDACIFYRDHLTAQADKEASALVATLADEWLAAKKAEFDKGDIAAPTIKGIRQTATLLKAAFPTLRIKALDKAAAAKFIYSQTGKFQQEGTRNRSGQFVNWVNKEKELTLKNPFDAKLLTIVLPDTDIEIFREERTKEIMALVEKDFREIAVYVAVGFFAGLRPGEAELLTWENIHLGEKTIHVLGTTSKSGVTHNVDIEENLAAWLREYKPKDGKGFICPQGKTLTRRRAKLHAALGYKADGKNGDAAEIIQDIMRHSYASHWQSKYKNVYKLAEMMANSVQVIRDYYKKVVSEAEFIAFWAIIPAAEVARREAAKEREEQGASSELEELDDMVKQIQAKGGKPVTMKEIARRNAKDKATADMKKMFGL